MREHVEKQFGVLKTTAIGGIVFLLPLVVVGALIGQLVAFVWPAAEWLANSENRPFDSPYVYLSVAAAAVLALLLLCFVCGFIARRSVGRWFTDRAERSLMMLFPRYAVFKDQLTGNLGGGAAGGRLKPVVVRVGSCSRLGMEVERADPGQVTVYLPSAPDPWTGEVIVAPEADVSPIDADYADVMATFEQLGRGVGRFVRLDNAPNDPPEGGRGAGGG